MPLNTIKTYQKLLEATMYQTFPEFPKLSDGSKLV